ncbi:hypothetical protein [Nocardia asiatica]|uniref:hypothetical protein n=1 Tax=Nocardia asiatica TaxID=209252 RepID=UPI003EE07544
MAHRTEELAAQSRTMQERREAYFAALRAADLDLRRTRYKRLDKLAEIDHTWPKGERARMAMDAQIAVETFGSPQARQLLGQWTAAVIDDEEPRMRAVYNALIELARHELGAQLPDNFDG